MVCNQLDHLPRFFFRLIDSDDIAEPNIHVGSFDHLFVHLGKSVTHDGQIHVNENDGIHRDHQHLKRHRGECDIPVIGLQRHHAPDGENN